MCGRVYETYTEEELAVRYLERRAAIPFPIFPKYNLCPTQSSPVLRCVNGARHFDEMRWQLVPKLEPRFSTKLSTINARSETIFDSRIFRDLIVSQRCIIPVSGFFEWRTDGKAKRPFAIHLRDTPIMSVAGIWDTWRPGTPEEGRSFSILTTRANEFMSTIHDRMPVILKTSDEDAWLDPEIHEPEILGRLLLPCPSSWLTAFEVSGLVNSPKNDSSDVLQPAEAVEKIIQPGRLF